MSRVLSLYELETMGVPGCPMPTPEVFAWKIHQGLPDQTQGVWCVGFGATELEIHWVVPMIWQIACQVVRSVP